MYINQIAQGGIILQMRCSDFYISTYMSNLKFIVLKLHYNNYAHVLIKSSTFPRLTTSQSYIVRLMHYSNEITIAYLLDNHN